MKKKVTVIVGTAVLLLLIVPVVLALVVRSEPRQYQGVGLAETRHEEIRFYNAAQDIQLGGLLFVPEGDGPFPAVVMIQGAGDSHRDNSWYLTPAQYLQENGIVVLLPDKRGSEQSEGNWRTAGFDDLATDTLAAVAYLKEQDIVPVSQIGIMGMSQGGNFSPLVAGQSDDVAFLVDVVGSAVPIYDQLYYEENHNLRQIGLLPGVSNLIAYPSAWSIRAIRQKGFWDAVGNFDALPYWQALTINALVLYGEVDTNVPSAASAARLSTLDKTNIEVRIYEGSGHKLDDPPGQGDHIFREEALQAIRDFVLAESARS